MIFSLGSFSHLSDPSRSPSLCFHCILLPINALATLYFKIFIMKSQSQKNSTILQGTLIHSQQLITFYHICFLYQCVCVCVCVCVCRWWWCLVTQLCLTLFWRHGLQTTRLLCPWDFPGKNIGVGCMPSSKGSSQPRDWTHVSCFQAHYRQHDLSAQNISACISEKEKKAEGYFPI